MTVSPSAGTVLTFHVWVFIKRTLPSPDSKRRLDRSPHLLEATSGPESTPQTPSS